MNIGKTIINTTYVCKECGKDLQNIEEVHEHHAKTDHHEYNVKGTKFLLGLA